MRILLLIAFAFVSIAPAHAQAIGIPMGPETKTLTPEEKEKQKKADDAYKASLKQIPETKTAIDPWGNIREPTPNKGAQAKPKAPKKTSGMVN